MKHGLIPRITNIKKKTMSKERQLERQQEIISLLEKTIQTESSKPSGGNSNMITILSSKLNKIKNWQYKEYE